ncbi:MAG: DUF4468 domain-containing protein [Cytophagaceae bacterium]
MRIKKICFIAIISLSFNFMAKAQNFPIDPETKKITYQEVVSLDSISQNELFERSKKWLITYFNKDKKLKEDKATGKIDKNGYFSVILTFDYKYKYEHTLIFNISIQHKDGRYRYILTDFMIYDNRNGEKTAQPLEAFYQKQRQQNKTELFSNFSKEIEQLQLDLKTAIETGELKSDDDW